MWIVTLDIMVAVVCHGCIGDVLSRRAGGAPLSTGPGLATASPIIGEVKINNFNLENIIVINHRFQIPPSPKHKHKHPHASNGSDEHSCGGG